MQSKRLLYFGKYVYGGHVDIKCKSFIVPLIRFQMKRQIKMQKCHIFCSKLLSKIFLVYIFAGTVHEDDAILNKSSLGKAMVTLIGENIYIKSILIL